MEDRHIINAYHDLAAAIVLQAMKDYKRVLRAIRNGKKDYRYLKTKRECEAFFLSGYGQMLTCGYGEYLMRKCRKEVEEDEK